MAGRLAVSLPGLSPVRSAGTWAPSGAQPDSSQSRGAPPSGQRAEGGAEPRAPWAGVPRRSLRSAFTRDPGLTGQVLAERPVGLAPADGRGRGALPSRLRSVRWRRGPPGASETRSCHESPALGWPVRAQPAAAVTRPLQGPRAVPEGRALGPTCLSVPGAAPNAGTSGPGGAMPGRNAGLPASSRGPSRSGVGPGQRWGGTWPLGDLGLPAAHATRCPGGRLAPSRGLSALWEQRARGARTWLAARPLLGWRRLREVRPELPRRRDADAGLSSHRGGGSRHVPGGIPCGRWGLCFRRVLSERASSRQRGESPKPHTHTQTHACTHTRMHTRAHTCARAARPRVSPSAVLCGRAERCSPCGPCDGAGPGAAPSAPALPHPSRVLPAGLPSVLPGTGRPWCPVSGAQGPGGGGAEELGLGASGRAYRGSGSCGRGGGGCDLDAEPGLCPWQPPLAASGNRPVGLEWPPLAGR